MSCQVFAKSRNTDISARQWQHHPWHRRKAVDVIAEETDSEIAGRIEIAGFQSAISPDMASLRRTIGLAIARVEPKLSPARRHADYCVGCYLIIDATGKTTPAGPRIDRADSRIAFRKCRAAIAVDPKPPCARRESAGHPQNCLAGGVGAERSLGAASGLRI